MVGVRAQLGLYGISISFIHVISVVSLVIVNRALLTTYSFPYSITLTVLQYVSISIALLFWVVFGIFRLRRMPLFDATRLAIGAALCSAFSNLSLRHNSLATFQAIRLCAAPSVLIVRSVLGTTQTYTPKLPVFSLLFFTILLFLTDSNRSLIGAFWGFIAVLATSLYQVLSFKLRITTKANELQLQLVTKSLGAIFLLFLSPLIDDTTSLSGLQLDESLGLMLLFSAFLAFLSFIAQRACVSFHTAATYNSLAYAVSVLIFTLHFIPRFLTPAYQYNALRQLPLVCAVMCSTVVFANARDYRDYRPVPQPATTNAASASSSRPNIFLALARAARNPALAVRTQKFTPNRQHRNTAPRGRLRNVGVIAAGSRPSQSEPDILHRLNEV